MTITTWLPFFPLVFSACNRDPDEPLVVMPTTGPAPWVDTCAPATGEGTHHNSHVTEDETWTAADGPHHLDTWIRVTATLTLEPCAVVEVAEGASITVGEVGTTGRIVAHGAESDAGVEAVTFRASDPAAFWGGFYVMPQAQLDFEWVEVANAGDADLQEAAIEAHGTQVKPLVEALRLLHTRIVSSGTQGIMVADYAAFSDDSTDLTILDAGAQPEVDERFPTGFPIQVAPPAVHTVPPGYYADNRRPELLVRPSVARVDLDEAFPNRGVPYLIDEPFLMVDVDGGDLTLEIEAGVTLRFDTSPGGYVGLSLGNATSDSEVRLLAKGTAEAPILLTSASDEPAPGAWGGVIMAWAPARGNVVSHTTFAYAGGETNTRGFGCGTPQNVGGLVVLEWKPAEAFITGSTFRDTRGAGIVSGWTNVTGENVKTDLRADNVFDNIVDYEDEGHCDVGEWHPDDAYCRNEEGITCVGE